MHKQIPAVTKTTKTRYIWSYTSEVRLPINQLWKSDLSNRYKAAIDFIAKHLGIDDRYIIREVRDKRVGDIPQITFNIEVYEISKNKRIDI